MDNNDKVRDRLRNTVRRIPHDYCVSSMVFDMTCRREVATASFFFENMDRSCHDNTFLVHQHLFLGNQGNDSHGHFCLKMLLILDKAA